MTELWTDKPPIGAEEVARAEQILQKYKVGKAALDQRLVDNELWFRMGHWKNYQNPMMEGQASAVQRVVVQLHCQQACRRHGQLPGPQCAAPGPGR